MAMQLGIRSTLYVGLAAMLAVVITVAVTAFMATNRTVDAATEIVDTHLPRTVETLQLARASDALLAAGSRAVFLVIEPSRGHSITHAEEVMGTLSRALEQFEQVSHNLNHVPILTGQLSSNLSLLETMVQQRIGLEKKRKHLRQEMLLNLQAFQEHLTHRVRMLQGDGDVITWLASRQSPDAARISAIAGEMTESISTMRFYAEIEAIHGRLLSAGQARSGIDLELSHSVLRNRYQVASQTFALLPAQVASRIAQPFAQLDNLINSEQGLVSLRHAELVLFQEGEALLERNRSIAARIDSETQGLVASGMRAMTEAGGRAERTRERYLARTLIITVAGLLGLAALMYFQIHRRLVSRLAWLSSAMQKIAAGETGARLPPEGNDELGRLGAALRQFQHAEVTHQQQEIALQNANSRTAAALKAVEDANEKLAELSAQDGLTGLANRRRFDEALQIEIARAAHACLPLSLLIIDVDYFKNFNDSFGHQAGDECLKHVAGAISSCARRASDVVARYGGEEFCVISPYTSQPETQVLADSIRTAVRDLGIARKPDSAAVVTVSIGCVTTDSSEEPSAEALVRAADKALYKAKALGRDRVEQGALITSGNSQK
jgi:diguanylate cyclase (GGDEF)-like protein